jgi:hypothetical protein
MPPLFRRTRITLLVPVLCLLLLLPSRSRSLDLDPNDDVGDGLPAVLLLLCGNKTLAVIGGGGAANWILGLLGAGLCERPRSMSLLYSYLVFGSLSWLGACSFLYP